MVFYRAGVPSSKVPFQARLTEQREISSIPIDPTSMSEIQLGIHWESWERSKLLRKELMINEETNFLSMISMILSRIERETGAFEKAKFCPGQMTWNILCIQLLSQILHQTRTCSVVCALKCCISSLIRTQSSGPPGVSPMLNIDSESPKQKIRFW